MTGELPCCGLLREPAVTMVFCLLNHGILPCCTALFPLVIYGAELLSLRRLIGWSGERGWAEWDYWCWEYGICVIMGWSRLKPLLGSAV